MNEKDNIIVMVSGGKDSTLCLALAKKYYKKVDAIFCDTGWEHELTYKYIDYLENRFNMKIYRQKGPKGKETILDCIRFVGDFPTGRTRFCTSYLKQQAQLRCYKENFYNGKTKHDIWLGIRTEESVNRQKKYGKLESNINYEPNLIYKNLYNKKLSELILLRFPILHLNSKQVFKWIKKLDVEINPLYNEGTNDRVGCYPCLLAGKKKQEAMFKTEFGQKQLKKIQEVENSIGMKYVMVDTDSEGICSLCKI